MRRIVPQAPLRVKARWRRPRPYRSVCLGPARCAMLARMTLSRRQRWMLEANDLRFRSLIHATHKPGEDGLAPIQTPKESGDDLP